ncbi:MAG: rhomboid family intramembrane serine protease [Planctomycetaceae bacterium]|nr:rhomboid family intramembrane serine protease [Planctomycetaceae bacterium]
MTAAYIAFAVGLFLAVQIYRIDHGISHDGSFDDALWKLGAVQPLVFVHDHPLVEEKEYPTGGPFDLWSGEWWRILISGFHHGDALHLLLNCVAIGFLGRLIEPVMKPWLYAAFLILATYVSLLPEYFLEHYPVGLSGGAYAMFGLLMMLRRIHPEIAEVFTEREINWGLGWLILCFVLTHFNIMNIANAAHVSGFVYGILAGVVMINQSRFAGTLWFLFVLSQVLVIPATCLVCNPVWNGKYYWYLARHENNLEQKIAYLQKGMELSPGEPKIGAELALNLFRTGEVPLRSWEIMLRSLERNRSYDKGVEITRLIWKQFHSDQEKLQALEIVSDVFGEESDAWLERFQLDQSAVASADVPLPKSDRSGNEFLFLRETDRQVAPQPRDLSAPPVDPRSPQSAMEGVTL